MSRADFPETTRRTMAMRAAFRCSNPRCGAVTIGPGAAGTDVVSTGVAAHIFAAASGGPRGSGGLPPAARSSIRNGVWLCANCARLVDSNRGTGYPSSLLRSWRDLREAQARIEQAGLVKPLGWISTLTVAAHPLFEAGTTVRFSRFNLVIGKNDSGKTSLIDLLRLLESPQYAAAKLGDGERIEVSATWHDPQTHEVVIRLERGSARYYLDGKQHVLAPRMFRLVELSESRWTTERKMPIERLGIDHLAVPELLDRQRTRPAGMLRHVHTDGKNLWVQRPSDQAPVPMGALSGGQLASIRLELASSLAAAQAQVEPTLLLMDHALDVIDGYTIRNEVIERFPRLDEGFQTVITTWRDDWVDLEDWNVIELHRSGSERRIQLRQHDL